MRKYLAKVTKAARPWAVVAPLLPLCAVLLPSSASVTLLVMALPVMLVGPARDRVSPSLGGARLAATLATALLAIFVLAGCASSSPQDDAATSSPTSTEQEAVSNAEEPVGEAAEGGAQPKRDATPKPEPGPDPLDDFELTQTTTTLEYSTKEVDPLTLIDTSGDGVTVTVADGQSIDLTKLGTQSVVYHLSSKQSSKDVELTFEVRDTRKPSIRLRAKEVTIEQGGSFDPLDNVKKVADKVDGRLSYVEKEPAPRADGTTYEQGWYTITGSYDVDSAGTYFLTVTACDASGNRTTKEFSLQVSAPAVEEPAEPVAQSYVLNTNTYKFHHPGCRDVGKIKDHNRQDVEMPREEVIAMGYSPCGHCHP